jgi:exopolysaccharide production protein ExoQ
MTSAWEMGGPRPRRYRETTGDTPSAAEITRLHEERIVARRARPAAQPEAAAAPRVRGLTLDVDGLFAFAIFLPLLFIAELGALAAAAVAGLTLAYLFVRRDSLVEALLPRSFLLLIPLFAIFSVAWSEAPGESFKLGVEFAITIMAGLILASARQPVAVLKGLGAAFLIYVVAALAVGKTAAIGVGAGGYALSGLSGSKNLLGDIASTGMIVSLALFIIGVRRREVIWTLGALLAMAVDLYVVVATRSAGALLGLGLGVTALLALAPLVVAGRAVRAWLTGAVAICLVAVGLSYRWITMSLIEFGAQVFDKDPTLTGRTYLWYRAADLIHEKPALGRGYYAFWVQGNIDAEGLWRYFGIQNRGGFTFHNTAVELLVTLGWVGLILCATIALIGVFMLVKRFVLKPSLALCCWIAILLYQVARMPIETIGVAPFYFSTLLMFAAFGAGFKRVRPARVEPVFQPQAQVVPLYPTDYRAAAAGGGGVLRLRRS